MLGKPCTGWRRDMCGPRMWWPVFGVGSPELLSVARLALAKAGAGSEAVKDRDAWIMCWSVSKEPTTICPQLAPFYQDLPASTPHASPFPPSIVHNRADGYGDCGCGSSCDGERLGTRWTTPGLFFPPFSLKFKFADRSKGRGGKQVSCVVACCAIDAGARIKEDTWSRRHFWDRSRQRNNTALPSVFFVLIAYTMQRNALIAVLLFLAAYMHIGNRYVDIYFLNAA